MDRVSVETGVSVGTLSLQIENLANSRLFSSDLVKDRKEETIPFPWLAFNQRARILDNLN